MKSPAILQIYGCVKQTKSKIKMRGLHLIIAVDVFYEN